MTNSTHNTMIDRILRTGLATPAMALTVIAGAAFAQQGGMGGRTYEVIIESPETAPEVVEKQAQKVQTRVRSRSAEPQDAEQARVVIEINRIVDGQTISVRRVNDEPITVKIDGKVIGKDHYEIKSGRVIISEPGTGRVHEITMPQQAAAPAAPAFGRIRLADPADVPDVRSGGWVRPAQPAMAPEQPRVMLGVVMGEPDAVVLEHLGLNAEKAVLLERVVDGLPADKAGLQAKDIIIGFGEKAEPRSADDIRKVLAKADPGTKVKVKVLRKGEPVTLDLKLEAFNASALGRVEAAAPGMGVNMGESVLPQRMGQGWAELGQEHHEKMAHAEQALREAAEMLAHLETQAGARTADAHRQASEAIKQAIEAMKQGDLAGLEIEQMRDMQQEAVERLRRELAANEGGQRFWAQAGEDGNGFALRFPGAERQSDAWADRLEQLEQRLNELERSVDRAVERLETRTEAMMERLMQRLEQTLEREDRRRR